MDEFNIPLAAPQPGGTGHPFKFRDLLQRLLSFSNQALTRPEFLRLATGFLLEFSRSDVVEIRLAGEVDRTKPLSCRGLQRGGNSHLECHPPGPDSTRDSTQLERILEDVLHRRFSAAPPYSTRNGSFWIGDTTHPILLRDRSKSVPTPTSMVLGGDFASLVIVPVPVDDDVRGVLLMGSSRQEFFPKEDLPFLEAAGEALGVAIAFQTAQWALRERVKELTCLYGIAKVARQPELSLGEILHRIALLLPDGWQYPSITSTRITLDGTCYDTSSFDDIPVQQLTKALRASLVVNGRTRGFVEVAYRKEMPEADEGPFLREERSLIDEIARQVGFIVEHREDEDEKARLRAELRRYHVGRQPDPREAD